MNSAIDHYANSIQQVRDAARECLLRVRQVGEEQIHESFLFRNQYFCGVRFSYGSFRAEWNLAEPTIRVYDRSQLIEELDLNAIRARNAA